MRLPDPIFRILDRVHSKQVRLRRAASRRVAEVDDLNLLEWADDMRARHESGACGGSPARCPFVPCAPKVGYR